MTVDPRGLAGVAAFLAVALLLLLYSYRRRTYILVWCVGWALVGTSMMVASQPHETEKGAAFAAGVSQFLSILAGLVFAVAAWSYRATWTLRRAHAVLLLPPLLWFALAPLALGPASAFVPGHVLTGATMALAALAHLRLAGRAWLPGAGAAGLVLALMGTLHLWIAIVIRDPSGDTVAQLSFVWAVLFLLGALGMQVMIFEDMTSELRQANRELESAQGELRELAVTDPLTRCRNRRFFEQVIGTELGRHRRYRLPLSLMFVDIDRFKAVNDELGHETGDQVLQEVAAFLMRNVREADYVFRWGGDEFLVLLSCRVEEARRRAAALQAAFAAAPGLEAMPPGLGLSIGCVEVPYEAVDITEYVSRADELMYADKRASRQKTISDPEIRGSHAGRSTALRD